MCRALSSLFLEAKAKDARNTYTNQLSFPCSASQRGLVQNLVSVFAMIISPAKEGSHRHPESPPICLSGFPTRYPLPGSSCHSAPGAQHHDLTSGWKGFPLLGPKGILTLD